MKAPIIFLVVGAMLMYLPSAVQVGMSTFWTEPNPYGYLQEQDQWSQFYNTCYLVVQFFGVIAFIRGLVILTHLGGHGGQQGSFGRGMTHIIGGILCINIYQFVHVIMITLGIQQVLGN
jgi:intracellular multiplication protein IcmC